MKKLISLLMVIVFVFSFCACGKTNESTGTPSGMRSVTDMLGNTIELPEKVERVYFDWASGITLAMTLGAVNKVIAKPTAYEEDSFAWARVICPEVNNVPTENDIFTSGNAESILSLEPDIVVTNTEENVETYKNVGMTTIYVNFNDYESFKESMLIVGTALGETERAAAEKYNKLLDSNISMVQDRTKNVADSDKKNIYYLDSRFEDAYHTVGTGEIQESWIKTAGGKLATEGHFEGKNIEITAEKFLEINPDIIMIGAQKQAEVYDMLKADKVLSGLKAVKSNQIYRIPQGIFPWCRTGPEAAIHVIWAGKFLHPELFEDIDMKQVAKDFYKDFYGTDVSDNYIDEILSGHLCPNSK